MGRRPRHPSIQTSVKIHGLLDLAVTESPDLPFAIDDSLWKLPLLVNK